VFFFVLLLVACAGAPVLRPGESGVEEVQREMGAPALRW